MFWLTEQNCFQPELLFKMINSKLSKTFFPKAKLNRRAVRHRIFHLCQQCDQICAKFRHFGTFLKALGEFLRNYLVFGKIEF